MRTILSTRIKPISIFHDPDKGGSDAGGDGGDTGAGGDDKPVPAASLSENFAKARGVVHEKKDEPDDDKPKDKKDEKPAGEKKPKKDLPAGADVPESVLAKKEDKKPEEKVDPTDEPPAHLSPKGRDDWKAYKAKKDAEIQTWQQKYAALEKELNETKPKVWKDDERAEFERYKKEYPEMESIVERIGLERSPQFQNKFVKGRAEIIEKAAKKVIAAGGDGKAFREAMGLTGRAKYEAIEMALGESPQGVVGQVHSLVTQVEDLDEERDSTLASGKVALEEFATQEERKKREQLEKQTAAQTARFEEVTELLKDDFFLLKEVEGNDKWNEMSKGIRERAKKFLFNASSFDDFATAAIAAESAPIFKQMYQAERNARLAIQEELEQYAGAEPGLKSGGDGGEKGGEQNPKSLAENFQAAREAA